MKAFWEMERVVCFEESNHLAVHVINQRESLEAVRQAREKALASALPL